MTKITDSINTILNDVKEVRTKVNRINNQFISKQEIKTLSESTSTFWFQLNRELEKYDIPQEILDYYDTNFKKLYTLSQGNQRKTSYQNTLKKILSKFKQDVIVPTVTNSPQQYSIESLNEILEIVSGEEKVYLTDAAKCADNDLNRACAILGWCAVAYRIHKKIQKIGFITFNQTTKTMVEKKGRYRNFTREYDINSTAELQNIPDSHLLIILEYLSEIDATEYGTLDTCLKTRNSCAHPGKYRIQKPKLDSYFSDLKSVVFENPNFS